MAKFSFEGRTALVTGGSRGLGLILARRLLDEGARVAICGRDGETLEDARRQLGDGPDLLTVQCDIGDAAQVESMVAQIAERFGPVEVLINNAGVIAVGPESSMDLSDYEYVMRANFWGALHTTLAVLPAMRERGEGRIVNITSIGGRVPVPHLLPYDASKYALVGFSDALRAELSRTGIAVTTVSPGLMRTGSPRNAEFKGRQDAEYAWFKIADSLPILSISAERAAERIIEAAREGRGSLMYPFYTRAAAAAAAFAPGLTTGVLGIAARMLPRWSGEPNARIKGHAAATPASSSWPARPTDRAAQRYNQFPGGMSRDSHNEDAHMASSYEGFGGTSRLGGRNVGGKERMISVAAGAALVAAGIRRRGAARALLLPLGTALIGRGVTGHCPVNRAIGRNSALDHDAVSPVASVNRGHGIKVERSVIIQRARNELYAYWRNFENLPRFMKHLESVTVIDQTRSHWVVKGPAGTHVEWDAEIHNEIPNELIAWRSVGGADVGNAGSVHFRDVDGGTEVRVVLSYEPPAGRVGAAIAKLFGEEPSQQVEGDLGRFRDIMEARTPAGAGAV
ncbi:MAG: SDR family NAD(P)-dependent oxidoreductase [Gemmatimonadota bacterium]|nr:SDR family NAD(P)-dependent oxidoreductase [Gemmatimonadota bacterium]